VPLNIDWDEFVEELKARHQDIAEVIRLRNKAQEPVRAVKLEFVTVTARNELLKEGEISICYMKLKVVEYFAQANVLICSNCCAKR
jgi:predicted helicase